MSSSSVQFLGTLRKAQPRVLVVDDEPMVLRSVQRVLGRTQPNWEVIKATGAAEAMGILENTQVDVVIADLQMPNMNGSELLQHVQKDHPQVVRIVLSGVGDAQFVFRNVPAAHQFLTKPFETGDFVAALERALELRKLLCYPKLAELVAGDDRLPSPPQTFSRLSALLANPNVRAAQVAELVECDAAVSGHLLKLASSSLFGMHGAALGIQAAVTCLGFDTVCACVLSTELFQRFPITRTTRGFSLDALQRRSVVAGRVAHVVAPSTLKDPAMVAGMLHEIGYLVLASRTPNLLEQACHLAQTERIDAVEAEYRTYETSHAEIGAYLLALWGLPAHIVEAVQLHHDPLFTLEPTLALPWCVNLASRWAHDPDWPQRLTAEESAALERAGLEPALLEEVSARAWNFHSGAREVFISKRVDARAG